MLSTMIGSLLIGVALTGQYFVGRASRYDNATGLTGWQIRAIRATPAWAYAAIWLFSSAFVALRHGF
jgi:hypothetical protein